MPSKHGVVDSAIDGAGMGLGFTLAICAMAAIRETLGWRHVLRPARAVVP